MGEYKIFFEEVLETIVNNSCYCREKVLKRFEPFNKVDFSKMSESDLFHVLAYVPFYAGMDSKVVTSKRNTITKYFDDYKKVMKYDQAMVEKMMKDPNMIGHQGKIQACIYNAKVVDSKVKEYGSFKRYLESLQFNKDEISMENAVAILMKEFKWLGEVTTHHFLTDIGAKTIKPDRVIMRVLNRMGYVKDRTSYKEARMICNKIVEETGFSHRYVDIVLVKFGHRKDDMDTGIIEGICLEDNPKCDKCLLSYKCKKNKETREIKKVEANKIVHENKDHKSVSNSTKQLVEMHSIEELNEITDEVKKLLKYLLAKTDQAGVAYRIKKRRDSIALTQKDDLSKNICTIWMSKMKINILVLGAEGELGDRNKKGKSIKSIGEIDDYLISVIKKKSEGRL